MRILLVDDEESLLQGLRFSLEANGFEVRTAGDGEQALRLAASSVFDAILLDVLMPRLDGLEACRSLRAEGYDKPILLLTALDDEVDKVVGLEVGADDYITKPFATREVLARIRAHLRRYRRLTGEQTSGLAVGRIRLDRAARRVWLEEQPLELAPREFGLLEYLLERPGVAVSRQQLLREVWGWRYSGDDATVNMAVRRLREKLPEGMLVTVRGVGYRLEVE